MKKIEILSKLFGIKVKPDNSRCLVQLLCGDGEEHYRWAPNPLKVDSMALKSAWKDDDLSFLGKEGVVQIDHVSHMVPEITAELYDGRHITAEHPIGQDELFCLYRGQADGYDPHYVWSSSLLDVIVPTYRPIFKDDQALLEGVTSIKIIEEGSVFLYKGKPFDLVRNVDGKLKVQKSQHL